MTIVTAAGAPAIEHDASPPVEIGRHVGKPSPGRRSHDPLDIGVQA